MVKAASRHAPATLVALAAALLVAGSAVAQPAVVSDKRAEAQRVLAEIREIDSRSRRRPRRATSRTSSSTRIAREQRANGRLLVVAKSNLGRAQRNLENRLVAIYTGSGESGSALEVLLGATSLEDLARRASTPSTASRIRTRTSSAR